MGAPGADLGLNPRPTLIVVSGPPGSGKTTLAHRIARKVGCPAICRDEIKEGIVHTLDVTKPDWGGPVSYQTLAAFSATLRVLLEHQVTVVAEAAFQHKLWEPELVKLRGVADVRIVQCTVDPQVSRARVEARLTDPDAIRAAHPDAEFLDALDTGAISLEAFEPITLDVPTMRVDTSDGYDPSFDDVVAFASAR